MNFRSYAEQIFLAGVKAVLPDKCIRKHVVFDGNKLSIGGHSFDISGFKNIYVIGAGKATALMAREIETIWGDKITEGHIIIKYGSAVPLRFISVTEAGHPVPDSNGFRATKEIIKIASKAGREDFVICLISGGASSLLIDNPEGCTEEDIRQVNHILVRSGATISEINTVRKHVSHVKGAQLARQLYPSTVATLVLSDVIGDSFADIGSGPTYPDSSTFTEAIEIVNKYNLLQYLPSSIKEHLYKEAEGQHHETPEEFEVFNQKVFHFLVGSNRMALEACFQEAQKLGFKAIIEDCQVCGDCNDVAERLFQIGLNVQKMRATGQPLCLLFGGEPTLRVLGNGVGGRNQHLALLFALLIADKPKITFLSAGTDGSDGPTLAAGAVVDHNTVEAALSKEISPLKYLNEFDSYHFFQMVGGHVITGQTMTNVMDIIVILIE